METVTLRRTAPEIPWGFRLNGGTDFRQKFTIQKVKDGSIAAAAGLLTGDRVIRISGKTTELLTHQQALDSIRDSGNEVTLTIDRCETLPDSLVTLKVSTPPTVNDYTNQLNVQEPVKRENIPPFQLPLAKQVATASITLTTEPNQSPIQSQANRGFNQVPRRQTPVKESFQTNGFSNNHFQSPEVTNGKFEEFIHEAVKGYDSHSPIYNPHQVFYVKKSPEKIDKDIPCKVVTTSVNTPTSPATHSFTFKENQQTTPHTEMNRGSMNGQFYRQPEGDVPDKLLTQFNKRPEDKPFSYLPTGGMQELQQKQKAAPPPTRPKPRLSESVGRTSPAANFGRQTSTPNQSAQPSHDAQSIFTPAFREYLEQQKNQIEMAPTTIPAATVGFGPGHVPQEEVKAFILQPDGTMAAIRPSNAPVRKTERPAPNLQNSAVMHALQEEQQAQERGYTTGRIRATGGQKQGLSFKVLQWLTGTDSEDNSETTSNYSATDGAPSQGNRRSRQTSFSQDVIPEDENGNEVSTPLYTGSNVPSKSFRRLLRSVSSTSSTEPQPQKSEWPSQPLNGQPTNQSGQAVPYFDF